MGSKIDHTWLGSFLVCMLNYGTPIGRMQGTDGMALLLIFAIISMLALGYYAVLAFSARKA